MLWDSVESVATAVGVSLGRGGLKEFYQREHLEGDVASVDWETPFFRLGLACHGHPCI